MGRGGKSWAETATPVRDSQLVRRVQDMSGERAEKCVWELFKKRGGATMMAEEIHDNCQGSTSIQQVSYKRMACQADVGRRWRGGRRERWRRGAGGAAVLMLRALHSSDNRSRVILWVSGQIASPPVVAALLFATRQALLLERGWPPITPSRAHPPEHTLPIIAPIS